MRESTGCGIAYKEVVDLEALLIEGLVFDVPIDSQLAPEQVQEPENQEVARAVHQGQGARVGQDDVETFQTRCFCIVYFCCGRSHIGTESTC